MATAPKPRAVIIYEGRDITADLKDHLLSVKYTDNVKGTSDEIEIQLEDSDGLWRNGWYPQKNDTVSLKIGYDNELIECGTFKVDEIEFSGPPDVVVLKGLAVPTSKALRTKTSKAHEGKPLRQIADETAKAHGLTIDDGTGPVTVPGPSVDDRSTLQVYGNLAKGISIERATIDWSFISPQVEKVILSLEGKGYTQETAYLRKTYTNAKNIFLREPTLDENTGEEKPGSTPLERWTGVRATGGAMLLLYDQVNSQPYNRQIIQQGVLNGIYVSRSTQNRETDLEYLAKVCNDFGIVFSVRDDKMIFVSIYALEARAGIAHITRQECKSYNFKDKITGTYQKARVRYHNQKTNEVVDVSYGVDQLKNADGVGYTQITAPDTLDVHIRAENNQQAEAIARAKLHAKNSKARTGNVTVLGNVLLIAGNNFELLGFGELSGLYHIEKSSHSIVKGDGYTTELEFKGLTPASGPKKVTAADSFPQPVRTEF